MDNSSREKRRENITRGIFSRTLTEAEKGVYMKQVIVWFYGREKVYV